MGSTYYSKRTTAFRYHRGHPRGARAKTFASEEAAKKYADAQGIKGYTLENLKSTESKTKKIRIVEK